MKNIKPFGNNIFFNKDYLLYYVITENKVYINTNNLFFEL